MMAAALLFSSAVLFCCVFPNRFILGGASFLAWGCAIPFLWALEGRPWRVRALLGLLWGIVAHGLLVAWLIPVSLGGWWLFTVALSIQGVLFAVFFPVSGPSLVLRLFLIPSVWVFSEWVRSLLWGGFAWGLGYAPAMFPELIQPASWGGVYAVSWGIIFVNTALFFGIRSAVDGNMRRRFFMAAAVLPAILLILGAVRIFSAPAPYANVRVAAIQANILRDDKTNDDRYDANVVRHLSLTKKAVMAGGLGADDLVVWPETAFADDILTDLKWRPRIEEAARNLRVNMLVGSALLWDGHDLNSAVLLSSQGVWQGVYHKMHLVPFSERTPLGWDGFARWMGIGKYSFTAGTRLGVLSFGAHKLGAVICSEEFYPQVFRHLSQRGTEVAVTMLNDGWFERREALLLHMFAAPVRAVESGLPVVRVANTGKTCAFDGYGRPLGRALELQRPGIGAYQVPLMAVRTFYAKWGDLFALACAVFVIINFMVNIVRGTRRV